MSFTVRSTATFELLLIATSTNFPSGVSKATCWTLSALEIGDVELWDESIRFDPGGTKVLKLEVSLEKSVFCFKKSDSTGKEFFNLIGFQKYILA